MKIWAHTLVRNEERYIWYAVMSVIDQVDKMLIWDTGSDDATVEIIKEIKKLRPEKVSFKQVGKVNPDEFTQVRQKMLNKTESDWFILVDGDEVWWDDSIKKLVGTIQKEGGFLDSIVNRCYNIVGDIYHYQEEAAGHYQIDEKRGHLVIRAMNKKIPGLHLEKPHGQQGFFDKDGVLIQERLKKRRKFLEIHYLHFTHMIRSSAYSLDLKVPKRGIKLKYELGIPFSSDFYYPEVFFRHKPPIVPPPWIKRQKDYVLRAAMELPLKRVKRRFLRPRKSGY